MRPALRLLAAILIGLLSGAASVARAETRIALVIGNSAYQNAPPLANPKNDATAVAEALGKLGFTVLTGIDLDRTATAQKLREFRRRLAGAEAALFYYAGHGLQVDGTNYIVPIDAQLSDETDLPFQAVELSVVMSILEREQRTNLVFLDACRDNPLAQNLARAMGAARSTAIGRGLAIVKDVIGGTLIAFATQPGNVALDGEGQHSPFTEALLEHIAAPDIEVREMLTRVRNSVLKATSDRQWTWDHSSLTEPFYFVARGLAVAGSGEAPSADREALFWDTIKSSANAAEYRAYLDRFPKGDFADLARNRLATLKPGPAITEAGTGSMIAALGLAVYASPLAQQQEYARAFGTEGIPGGLVISQVEAGSDAAARGLRAGDVILRVQSGWVGTPRDLEREVEVARAIKDREIRLEVLRGATVQTFTVRIISM